MSMSLIFETQLRIFESCHKESQPAIALAGRHYGRKKNHNQHTQAPAGRHYGSAVGTTLYIFHQTPQLSYRPAF